MIRAVTLSALLLVAVAAAACGSSMSQVPVKGGSNDVTLLAGQWRGGYEGLESGRRGTITFDLQVGRHTAEGKVLMEALGASQPAQPLQIQFISVANGRVTGRIGPYSDPQCRCQVETRFEGTVRGDTIRGTFVSRLDDPEIGEQTGWWSVERAN